MDAQQPKDFLPTNICSQTVDYQGIVRHINEGVLIIRNDQIVFANTACGEIVGHTCDALLGQSFVNLVSQADQEKVTKQFAAMLRFPELPDRMEFSLIKSGEVTTVEMKLAVIDCQGPAILAALTDITERRKTRTELQRIKDQFESILHSMNDVVVSLSVKEHTILNINPAAEALYEVPRRALRTGKVKLMQFVHPEDQQMVQKFFDNLVEEEFDELEYRIISRNGRIKWVHDEGRLVYCTRHSVQRLDHVIRDITRQKEALDALTRSEKKYRDFFHNTKDMAYTISPEGRFLDINEAGIQMLGFAHREEALKANIGEFYEDLSDRADFLAQINEDGFVADKHVRFKLKDGRSIEVSITARAKTDDSGYLLLYEGIAHNITQALENQRNRVLRNAAGGMCHHMNTHLMHIINANDGILEDVETLAELMQQEQLSPEGQSVWGAVHQSLLSYAQDLKLASSKITAVTRAFNSAFLNYREEAYLDKTILDIFSAYPNVPDGCQDIDCEKTPSENTK